MTFLRSEAAELLGETTDEVGTIYRQAMKSPGRLRTLMQMGSEIAGYAAVAGEDDQVVRGLRLAGRSAAALFDLAARTEGTRRLPMEGDDVFELPATGPNDLAGPGDWLMGFLSAMAVRDASTLDRLSAIPVDVPRQAPGVSVAPYVHLYIECLQAVWKGMGGVGDLLRQTLEATDSAHMEKDFVEWALHIDLPAIELLYRIHVGDQEQVSAALEKGLKAHRAYYRKGTRKRDPIGFLAVPLAAMAVFARGQGMAIDGFSPGLPSVLLR